MLKKMKRILSVMLACALALCLQGFAAEAKPELRLESPETVKAGEEFQAKLYISNNPGLAAIQLTLKYDAQALTCLSCSFGEVLDGALSATNPGHEDGAVIAAAGADLPAQDGLVASFTFRADRDCAPAFTIKDLFLSDSGENPLSATVTGAEYSEFSAEADGPSGSNRQGQGGPGEAKPNDGGAAEALFTDTGGHWAEEFINAAAKNGLVNGYGDGRYGPGDKMTRAQFVTILWRNAGEPAPDAPASFTDLDASQDWYHDAVAWAEQNGIVNGIGGGKFGPGGYVSREQLAAILFRMSGDTSGGEQLYMSVYQNAFIDAQEVSDWAWQALCWAVYREIWCGTGSPEVTTELSPGASADRAQIAVMIIRYENKMSGGI